MPVKKKHVHKYRYMLLALAAVVAVLAMLELTNTTYLLHSAKSKPVAVTGGAFTKGADITSKPQTSMPAINTVQPTTSTTTKNPGTDSSTADLLTPWGTFANTYKARVNDQMGSTCNTTSGATCQIIFTNGSLTASLPTENTDAGGAVYWSWTPSQIGLTPGTWHMTMKAVLGSQTKTTSNDPLTLQVTQ